ncbi:MAG: prenyltransferase [Candidatus Bathyarchaeota archaeon]|nr:MAG: prenyltransferase [Candidatus Bathyarchaeota archaeon]
MLLDRSTPVFEKIRAIFTLLRVYTTPFYIPAVLSGFILAGNLNISEIVLFTIVVLFILFLTNTLNFYYDEQADILHPMAYAENPFTRQILTSKEALTISLFFSITPIVISLLLGVFWVLGAITGLFLGIIYNVKPFRLKAKPYGWFVDAALSPPLAFLFAYTVASSSFVYPNHILMSAAFFYFAFVPIVTKDIPDMNADASVNDRTFPIVFGIKTTQVAVVSSIAVTFFFYLLLTLTGVISFLGLPIALFSMTGVSKLVLRRDKLMDRSYVYLKICIAGVSSFSLIFVVSLIMKTIFNR